MVGYQERKLLTKLVNHRWVGLVAVAVAVAAVMGVQCGSGRRRRRQYLMPMARVVALR